MSIKKQRVMAMLDEQKEKMQDVAYKTIADGLLKEENHESLGLLSYDEPTHSIYADGAMINYHIKYERKTRCVSICKGYDRQKKAHTNACVENCPLQSFMTQMIPMGGGYSPCTVWARRCNFSIKPLIPDQELNIP